MKLKLIWIIKSGRYIHQGWLKGGIPETPLESKIFQKSLCQKNVEIPPLIWREAPPGKLYLILINSLI